MTLLFSCVSSPWRPDIPHVSGAMQEQRSEGKPHKGIQQLPALKDQLSAHREHPYDRGEGKIPFPRGWEIDPLCESTKTEQIKWWTVIFLASNHPRRAQLAQPPPISPQRPGRAGRGRRAPNLGPRMRPSLSLQCRSSQWPVLHSSGRNQRSRAGWRWCGGRARAAELSGP